MAGLYPDAPSRRMAWDHDCVALEVNVVSGGVLQEFSDSEMIELNDEDSVNVVSLAPSEACAVIFPELREVDGVFGKIDANTGSQIETSPDTTNGFDGTWTVRDASPIPAGVVAPFYRTEITSTALSNQRGARFRRLSGTNQFRAFHIYGEISASETPDRLLWFDQPTALEFALPIDYGDIARGSAEDRVTFIKNNSSALTASTVQVTAESLFQGSGSWYTFSEGGAFVGTLSLASSIANGANSPNITIRRIVPDAETLGLHSGRAYVNVGSWA